MHQPSIHIGEGPPELNECAVDERLVLLLALRCTRHMNKQYLVVVVLLLEQGGMVEPVRDHSSFAATFITCDD